MSFNCRLQFVVPIEVRVCLRLNDYNFNIVLKFTIRSLLALLFLLRSTKLLNTKPALKLTIFLKTYCVKQNHNIFCGKCMCGPHHDCYYCLALISKSSSFLFMISVFTKYRLMNFVRVRFHNNINKYELLKIRKWELISKD
jgi:hypothetical protein